MGVRPKSKVDVEKGLGNLLIKTFPQWFIPCSAPVVAKEEPEDEPKETKGTRETRETKKDEVKKK